RPAGVLRPCRRATGDPVLRVRRPRGPAQGPRSGRSPSTSAFSSDDGYYTAMTETPHAQMKASKWELILEASSGFGEGAARSLVYWAQGVVKQGLMGKGGRIFSMTSSGSTRVFATYGAVSAAKAALESHTRQLALELAPLGIAVNALRGGVTDTPALRKIPGNEKLIEIATQRNPHHRLTTPADLGGAIVAWSHPGADWIR